MEMFVFLDNVQKTPLTSNGCAHPEYCAETHAGLQPLPCVVLGVGVVGRTVFHAAQKYRGFVLEERD